MATSGARDGAVSVHDLVAALTASVDPRALMGRIAEQMCVLTPKADGATVSIVSGDTFVVVSAHGLVASTLGLAFPVQGTLMGAAIDSGCPQGSDDATTDELLLPHVRELSGRLGVRALVVIPLLHRGAVIGAMTMVARAARGFEAGDVSAMQAAGRFASALIASHTELSKTIEGLLADPFVSGSTDTGARFMAALLLPDDARRERMHRRLDDVLANPGCLRVELQPIVDLRSRTVVGYEGLTRFPEPRDLTPTQWFDMARQLGRSASLEMAALEQVFGAAAGLPPDCFIAVNASPRTVMDPVVQEALLSSPRPLVVEITEHEPFPTDLARAVAPLREHGVRIAVDDTGAGYASFAQLLRLRPDIIKVDGTLTSGIDTDPVKRALVTAVARLAAELPARTVAEGIETRAELDILRHLGIDLGQGYHFVDRTPG